MHIKNLNTEQTLVAENTFLTKHSTNFVNFDIWTNSSQYYKMKILQEIEIRKHKNNNVIKMNI